MCETINPLLCGWSQIAYSKKSPFRYNRVVQALLQKGTGDLMANKNNELAHTKWICKYHIVFTPKYRRKIIYNQLKVDIRDTKRVNELNMLMKKLYEDNISGKLSDKRFEFMLSEFENEQDTLEISMENAKAEIEKYESDTVRADKFIELVIRYTDFSELTTPMLNEFVEKIRVHEADYSSGERVQEVEIYLNFIGKFELPVKEPTAEEIAEHEKLKARRAKKAEYNRRYMEKRRKRIAGEEQKSKEVTVNG